MSDADAQQKFSLDYTSEEAESLAAILDAAAVEAREPWDLLDRMTVALRGDDGEFQRTALIVCVERAFAHSFEEEANHKGALRMGVRFSSPDGSWPPGIDTVPLEEKEVWEKLSELVNHPLPKAQLLDLLFTSRRISGPKQASGLIQIYVDLAANSNLDPYYRASCLRRAWSVARQYELPTERDLRRALYAMGHSLVIQGDVPPGILLRPFESLVVPPRTGDFIDPTRRDVRELLEKIRADEASMIVQEGVTDLLVDLAENADEIAEARRVLAAAYLDTASASQGMLSMHWLQTAAQYSQAHGLTDLRDKAVRDMQSIPPESLGMESHVFDFTLPMHIQDGRLRRYRWSRDLLSALEIWLATDSPTGDHEANVEQSRELSRSGIRQLVTRTTFEANGLPLRTSVGPEQAETEELERVEQINARFYSLLLARELDAIKQEYGVLEPGLIAAHFVRRYGCNDELGQEFAECLSLYWEGRYSDAGRAAFPLIEAALRGTLWSLGSPLFRIQTGDASGKFPALETYLTKLEEHEFDPSWLRCLRNPIATLRNALAHGHRFRLESDEAALLIRCAGLLVLLTPPDARQADRDSIATRLVDPIGWAATQVEMVRGWSRVWVPRRTQARSQ